MLNDDKHVVEWKSYCYYRIIRANIVFLRSCLKTVSVNKVIIF